MISYATKIYGPDADGRCRVVHEMPLIVAEDADRCREVAIWMMPSRIKAMPNLLIVSNEMLTK